MLAKFVETAELAVLILLIYDYLVQINSTFQSFIFYTSLW